MKIVLIFLLLFSSIKLTAQQCPYFPADCPDDAGINSAKYTTEGLLPQEIEMQNRVRDAITTMMLQASKQLHWQTAELNEVSGTGPLQAGGTPYEYRSPRMFSSEWQLIVDKDSLTAWKNWLEDFGNRLVNNMSSYTSKSMEIVNSPLYKAYSDSIDDYTNRISDYAEKHKSEGIALIDGKTYKSLQSKMNDFTDKRSQLMKAAEGSYVNPDEEKTAQTARFREGATIHVLFYINYSSGSIKSSEDDKAYDYKIPGSFISKSVSVTAPIISGNIDDLGRYKHFVSILLGKWSKQMNQYNGYNSQFADLPGQNDEHALKKIKSDKIQTIAIYIIGSEKNIQKILPFINISTLNGLTTTN